MRVGDGEVGCEHRRSDFAAVRVVADKFVDETWTLGWLGPCQRSIPKGRQPKSKRMKPRQDLRIFS
jgi:hypothetical protein